MSELEFKCAFVVSKSSSWLCSALNICLSFSRRVTSRTKDKHQLSGDWRSSFSCKLSTVLAVVCRVQLTSTCYLVSYLPSWLNDRVCPVCQCPHLDSSLPSGEGNFSCLCPVGSPQLVFVINDLDDNETNSANNAGPHQNKDLEEGGR